MVYFRNDRVVSNMCQIVRDNQGNRNYLIQWKLKFENSDFFDRKIEILIREQEGKLVISNSSEFFLLLGWREGRKAGEFRGQSYLIDIVILMGLFSGSQSQGRDVVVVGEVMIVQGMKEKYRNFFFTFIFSFFQYVFYRLLRVQGIQSLGVSFFVVQRREEKLRDGFEGKQVLYLYGIYFVYKVVKCRMNNSIVD